MIYKGQKGGCGLKKEYVGCFLAILIPILLISILIVPRSNTRNAEAVISSDYSTITYKNKLYVPIEFGDLPATVAKSFLNWNGDDTIKATVEKENYFLDKYFFTNQLVVKDLEGETFIYLNTDYDVNESDYYCTLSYKERVFN